MIYNKKLFHKLYEHEFINNYLKNILQMVLVIEVLSNSLRQSAQCNRSETIEVETIIQFYRSRLGYEGFNG